MKKRVKILLWVLGIIVLLWAWVYCYMTYIISKPIHFCPRWYYPIISTDDFSCNDCELTRKQIRNWETSTYNDECRSIQKRCYECVKPAPKYCHCLDDYIYVKIE